MYVLINREALHFCHAHPVPEVLCNIAWIELRHVAYSIAPCDFTALRGFTELELKMLYRNTTGQELTTTNRNSQLQVLCNLLENMKASEICAFEAEVQAGCLTDENQGFYRYVAGAKKPAIVQELFCGHLKGKVSEEEMQSFLNGNWPSLKSAPAATKHSTSAANAAPNTPAPVKTSAPQKEPGVGTTSHKIWSSADAKWEEMGKEHSPHIGTAVRKAIAQGLIDSGINKSTVNTQLAHWQKNRFNL